MARVKSFDSTGIAPYGRLYAGDLNAIQDNYLAVYDLTQSAGLGSLTIGEDGLQISRYGAGEMRISGALRTDKIFRGLGGLVAGTFSTAQRDAIPAGQAPYGIEIVNTTTNRYEWNSGTDAARVWKPLGGSETGSGSGAMGPPGQPGRTFYDTSVGLMWLDLGTSWMVMDGQVGDIFYYSGVVSSLTGLQEPQPGRLLCNGAQVPKVGPDAWHKYDRLYAKWGANRYSTDVGANFVLPNALGKVLVPQDTGQTEFASIGQAGGEKTHTVSVAEMPNHGHTVNDPQHAHSVYDPTHTHGVNDPGHLHHVGSDQNPAFNPGYAAARGDHGVGDCLTTVNATGITIGAAGTGVGIYNSPTGITLSTNGSNVPHNNIQPYIVIGAATVKY